MNLPDAIRTVRWMVRDTLRQAVATKLFWVILAVTLVASAFCLSVEVRGDQRPVRGPDDLPLVMSKAQAEKLGMDKVKADGVHVISGELTMAFGAIKVPVSHSREDSVRMLELMLVAALADTAGVLLALLWTAGFLPTFLEPQSATVLLAKPAPRWSILLGKYLGVVLFVALSAMVFVGATWLALGVKTGVWYAGYWVAVPLLVVNFGVFYSVSAFLAVWTRSTVASAFGTLLFWVLCWVMNFTHHQMATNPVPGVGPAALFLMDAGYWFLPKPLDMSGIFFDAMQAEGFAASKVEELRTLQESGRFHPELSVAASCGFAALTLGLAAYEFETTEY
jgi:ABC-type transport system involved in multi-copper enzyme maturation permease subunit